MKKKGWVIGGVVVVIVIIGIVIAMNHKSKPAATATTTSSQSSTPAVNNAVLVTKTDSTVGQYLADPSGKALYVYGGDSANTSNCTGSCLAAWPAYQANGSTSNLPTGVSTITRTDNGQIQYTYNGMPLYYFASDPAGKVTGNGVGNFTVAKPAAASSSTPTSSSSTPATTDNSSSSSNSGYSYP